MGTALATQDVNMDELKRMGMMLALSGYFDQHNDQGVATAQMCVKVLAGREIGFGPFAAVNGIHIIKGKPSISANIMAAKVKSHPAYDYRVRVMTDKEVAIDFFETVDGKREKIGTSEFTAADAAKAQTQNMGKFPRNMLFARAMSNGVRWYCPDVFSGNSVYTPEELGARTDDEGYIIVDRASGEVIESPKLPPVKPASKPIESLDEVEELPFDEKSDAEREWDELSSVEPGQPSSAGAKVQRPDWNNPNEAKEWAVSVGACNNEFEARASLKKIVDGMGGKLNAQNMDEVMDAFHARQLEKLAEAQAVPA